MENSAVARELWCSCSSILSWCPPSQGPTRHLTSHLFASPLASPHLASPLTTPDAELMEMIERADTDGDGEISPDEFYAIMTKKTFT